MQKLASTDSAKTARQMTVLGFLFCQGRSLMILLWGIAALAMLGNKPADGMDPNMYSKVAGAIYLGKLIPPVLFGVMLAGMLAAFISTVDTYLLTWATVIVNDVICPLSPKMSPRQHFWLLRIFVALIAIFLYVFGIIYQPAESIWVYITVTGVMMLGSGIILIGGLYWKRGSTAGAYAAVIFCCLLPAFDLLTKRIFGDNAILSTQWFALLAIVLAIILYIVFSILFPKSSGTDMEAKKS
jgi:SSS family solute:Na+ symporter